MLSVKYQPFCSGDISLAIRSLQIQGHDPTAYLPWHVQNFVAFTTVKFGNKQNEIAIAFELLRKRCYWNGALGL